LPFLHGCNYPWSSDGTTAYYGLDFGDNIWGSHVGVSTRRAAIERDFTHMASLGLTVARWFVFCDGRCGIVYDDRGFPDGPDSRFFGDLDTGLEVALSVGMGLDLVLLDHRWMFDGVREHVVDPITGARLMARLPHGRSHVLRSRTGRDALVERLFAPIVRRYAPGGDRADLASAVMAYELMNEPDFVVEEWERDVSPRVRRPVPFECLAELVSRLSDLVHACSTAMTTIAAARVHNLWAWDDVALGLDALQVHSYPDLRRPGRDADIFGRPADSLGVHAPVILGEFPGNGPERHPAGSVPPDTTLADYLEFAVRNGYLGAWPWSFSGTDEYGPLPDEPLLAFARRYPHLVNPRCEVKRV